MAVDPSVSAMVPVMRSGAWGRAVESGEQRPKPRPGPHRANHGLVATLPGPVAEPREQAQNL